MIPWLYLKGISTGDFSEALEALLGPDAPGLSATTVVRLKDVWRREYEAWSKRDLSGQRFVYIWADGIYSNVRLDDERQCLLVVMGALEDGRKQLLAVHDGFRESELSWQELLEDLKRQGLELPPKLAVGDGAMGFWAALRKVYPATGEQRCWLHKTANVLNKLPQSMQGKAKQALRDIYLAESRQTAEAFLLASFAGGILFFVSGYLAYGVLLKDFMVAAGMKETPNMGVLILSQLIFGVFLTMVLRRWEGVETVAQAARAGAALFLLVSLGFDLVQYATAIEVNPTVILVGAVVSAIQGALAGGAVGAVLSRS